MVDEAKEIPSGRRPRRIAGLTALVAAVGIGGLVLGGAVSTAWGSASDTGATTTTESGETAVPNDTQVPDTTTPDTTTPDTQAPDSAAPDAGQWDAYRQCLADHGVTLPDPGTRGGPGHAHPSDADRATRQAAEKACEDQLPDSVRQKRAEREAKMAAFAQCMRDNGVDLPTPAPGEPKPAMPDVDRATMQKALQACKDLAVGRPGFGPGGPHSDGPGHHGRHGGQGCDHDKADDQQGGGSSNGASGGGDSQSPPATDAPTTDTPATNSSFHYAA